MYGCHIQEIGEFSLNYNLVIILWLLQQNCTNVGNLIKKQKILDIFRRLGERMRRQKPMYQINDSSSDGLLCLLRKSQ